VGSLQKIGSFGDVAAEDDDSVLSYFLKTAAVDQIESGKAFAVIGRKGSGKTALTKYFSQPRKDYVSASPTLRDYPWNIHSTRRNLGASDIESYVSAWRYLIAVKANSIVIEQKGMKTMTDSQRAARDFLNENYGGISPSLADIMRPNRLKITKKTLAPRIMGNSLGSIDIEDSSGGLSPNVDTLTKTLLKNASTLASQSGVSKICIHFDELDQGLGELDNQRKEMLIGLILAIRSIRSGDEGNVILPVFYIRSDLWDKIRFRIKTRFPSPPLFFWNGIRIHC
jgi:energy-coupling factor transporter ATP-binding protein EcfA2